MNNSIENLESQWARLGVLFNCAPASETPDLERLLIETARQLHLNGRLLPLVSTWLVKHGLYVARHRLKRLIAQELEVEYKASLGLLLDVAVSHGAPAILGRLCDECTPLVYARPLSASFRAHSSLHQVAQSTASELSQKWGLWSPPIQLKLDAVCPSSWIRKHCPDLLPRLIRKGDLRCSILEIFLRDVDHSLTVSQLARLTSARQPAVRDAIKSLIAEGELDRHVKQIWLAEAA